ncbi:MAG: hypothetical protein H8E25_07480 [Planctomycetes bacterium]|nr:hypothetical protein [Planctomycetota bacterium]
MQTSLAPLFVRGFLLLLLGACSKDVVPEYLQVETNLSSGAELLAINQPIKVAFNSKLQRPVRSSAVSIIDDAGRPVSGYELFVVGNTIEIVGALPAAGDLSDGTFKPSQSYTVLLKGLPAVSALRSEQNNYLHHDVMLRVAFLSLDHQNVLTRFDANVKPIRVTNQVSNQAIDVSKIKSLRLNCDGPIDPRSLESGQLILANNSQQNIACRLRLLSNNHSSSVLEVELPKFSGTAYLVLPETLEGIGQRDFSASTRQFRLVSAL